MNKLPHPSMFETDQPVQSSLLSIHNENSAKISQVGNLPEISQKQSLSINDSEIYTNNTKQLLKNTYDNTLLTAMFFSRSNITSIQNIIKYLVHKETNNVIDSQSYSELLIIMRAIFLEYSAHPPYITNDLSQEEKVKLYKKYTSEVDRLNQIVANSIVPRIISQLKQYISYLKDASTQPSQMERPRNENIAGQKQYRSITQVLMGGDL